MNIREDYEVEPMPVAFRIAMVLFVAVLFALVIIDTGVFG